MLLDMIRGQKPSALGACIGAVVGLVAITPAAGYVNVGSSICIGVIASAVSYFVVSWKSGTTIDDIFPARESAESRE